MISTTRIFALDISGRLGLDSRTNNVALICIAALTLGLAGVAAWQAYAQVPLTRAVETLDIVRHGGAVPAQQLSEAGDLAEQAYGRGGMAEARLVQAQALLARLALAQTNEQVTDLAIASQSAFSAALIERPNAPQGWRGLLAASFFALSDEPDQRAIASAALTLDRGDPFTALTAVEIVLRQPSAFDDEIMSLVTASIPKLEASYRTRRKLARVLMSLDARGRAILIAHLSEPEQFTAIAERLYGS